MNVRCLACATVFEWSEAMPMCPARYLSPHDELFLEAVATRLQEMGTLEKTTEAEHRAAIAGARTAREKDERWVAGLTGEKEEKRTIGNDDA